MRRRYPSDSRLAVEFISDYWLHLLRTVLIHIDELIRHGARTTCINSLYSVLERLLQVLLSHCSSELIAVGDSSGQKSVSALVRDSLVPV